MDLNIAEEIRDGYLVDEKHKRIWRTEIGILQEIIRICDKYDISYFVYGGTLLGAARHKGFIPWDDDMDVAMLRRDYEIFLEKASEELDQEKYDLQKSEMFGEIFEGFSRIRDRHSTAIIYRDRNKNCSHGIFVDIFPLDHITEKAWKRKIQFAKIRLLSGLIYYRVYQDAETGHPLMKKMIGHFGSVKMWERLVQKLKKECVRYNHEKCSRAGILSCDPYDEKCWWYLEDIERTTDLEFEGLSVKAPAGYEKCLETGYGNWREFPPVEERENWHQNIFFDPCKPYWEYVDRDTLFKKKG